ncbi:MAG: GNAT family N-acetyltransferase [Oligoflexia bacterium]|nr:GNAT family N-acetyltransferase [Oligoflexia bacterium]
MDFNLKPTLKEDLITLRPLEINDFDALFLAASDPLIWVLHPSPLRYQVEDFKKYFNYILNTKGALSVIDLKKNKIIGASSYYELDEHTSEVCIGYTFLERAYWGGLYNKEMKNLMLNHAFKYVDHVIFHVDPRNIRSQRAMEKLGATKSGPKPYLKPDGIIRDVYFYQIDKG